MRTRTLGPTTMVASIRRASAILLAAFPAPLVAQTDSAPVNLRIDPLLIAEAAEVWDRARRRNGFVIDYTALASPRVAMAFSPFGITVVDEDRTVFSQVPISVGLADGTELEQRVPRPVLQDKKRRVLRFRLHRSLTREEVERAPDAGAQTAAAVALELPEFTLRAPRARLRWEGTDLRVVLLGPEQ